MSSGDRIPLSYAEALVERLRPLLASCCTRLEVAGSIRRRSRLIGDLEIVCRPLIVEAQRNLFDEPIAERNLLDERVHKLMQEGTLKLRVGPNGATAHGPRLKRLLYEDFPLDLFSVLDPAQWGVIFTLRTGSAAFSKRLVTSVAHGGWMPLGMRCQQGALWFVTANDETATLCPTPEESDVFRAIGRPWIAPERREVG